MKLNRIIEKNYLSIFFFIILLVILCGGLLANTHVSADTGNPLIQNQVSSYEIFC